jgi:serine/threonine protein kinase
MLRLLKKGGMGALYLASQTIVGQERQVVVKEMLHYYDRNDPHSAERAKRRFETEAATLANLSIAGVPQVFDYFSEGGCNYIVMQYIEGRDLEDKLTHLDENDRLVRGSPHPVEQVRRWGIRLCKILEALAAKSVVHLDIKPANLILDSAEDIWLVDFGSAWSKYYLPAAGQQPVATKPSIYGTQGYAPLEQVKGKPEQRSDVYALAATLYHLMTDQAPGDPPDPFPQLDRLPGDIAQALKQALAQNVRQRITAAQFGQRLERQVSSGLAFYWADGSASLTLEDLAAAANDRWEEALGYFKGDNWKKWLQDRHRNDLAARLKAVKTGQTDEQLALDEFLHILDPFLPAAKLHLPTNALDIGIVPWQTKIEREVKIENKGSGCLQVSFANLPAGVAIQPPTVVVHDVQAIKINLDSGAFTPSKKRQPVRLEANAGTAGQGRITIRLVIPEPVLKLSHTELVLNDLYPGQVATSLFDVSNQGGSLFNGEVNSSAPWVQIDPTHFRCEPGKNQQLKVLVNMAGMSLGEHVALMDVKSQAGNWKKSEQVQMRAQVSPLAAFLKYGAPPLLWMALLAGYGLVAGAIVGGLFRFLGEAVKGWVAILLGAFLGCFIYIVPWTYIGVRGGIEGLNGAEGAKWGAILGGVIGGLAGLLAGLLLNWLDYDLSYRSFGGVVGTLVGASLGLVLYVFSPTSGKTS